jgi:hypothetical protein
MLIKRVVEVILIVPETGDKENYLEMLDRGKIAQAIQSV